MKILIILFTFTITSVLSAPEGFRSHLASKVGRIVGGYPVKLGDVPYHALVVGSELCGGSLISRTWILTGGHCIYDPSEIVLAALGIINLYADPLWAHGNFTRDKIVLHPQFELVPGVSARNNLALLDLRGSAPIPESPYIQPILLPLVNDGNINLVGRVGRVSGFGVDLSGAFSNDLNALDLTVIDNSACDWMQPWFHPGHICTANPGFQSICWGDGGGPFAMEIEPGRRVLIAMASFVIGEFSRGFHCYEDIPSAFLTINPYLSWIHSVIGV